MATYIVGDIHGAYLALTQVLERASFVPEEDRLISLGDVVDGWHQSFECIEFLLHLPDAIFVRGNHDYWCHQWISGNRADAGWLNQGGMATWQGYQGKSFGYLTRHKELFFDKQVPYYEQDNCLFVHGGYHPEVPIDQQDPHALIWDRELWRNADKYGWRAEAYKHCFIGHTTTMGYGTDMPLKRGNITNLDTGAGFNGRLTVMRLEDGVFWQSDPVQQLYPGIKGRPWEDKWKSS